MSIEQKYYEIKLINDDDKDYFVKLDKTPKGFLQVCVSESELMNVVERELFEQYFDAKYCFLTKVKELLINDWEIPSSGQEDVTLELMNFGDFELIFSARGTYRIYRGQNVRR